MPLQDTKIEPESILEWPVTIIKSTKNVIVLRDHSGAEIEITSFNSELIFKRIW